MKIWPDSGWTTDAQGNLPTITLITETDTFIGTPRAANVPFTVSGVIGIVPITNYSCTDNQGNTYSITTQWYSGMLYQISIGRVYP